MEGSDSLSTGSSADQAALHRELGKHSHAAGQRPAAQLSGRNG
jgi:hypothetical protein